MSLQVSCLAKINLFLNICGKRQDGFHEIQSIFQNISLADTLYLSPSQNFGLTLDETSAPFADPELLEKDNILQKVFHYFSTRFKVSPIQIKLNKQIPLGAGLGGGSSNAAGLILALNQLNGLSLPIKELERIAAKFGSDVPFFIRGGLAKVTGRGEIINPFTHSFPKHQLILIYPAVNISTKEAYGKNICINDKFDFSHALQQYSAFTKSKSTSPELFEAIRAFAYNSFESKTLKAYPPILEAYKDLKQHCDYVLLSGSGSSVFALFKETTQSQRAFELLQTKHQYIYLLNTSDSSIALT